MTRQRTIAACHASAVREMAPWNVMAEDRVITAWRAVESIGQSDAAQEWRMIDAMHEKLTALKEARRG